MSKKHWFTAKGIYLHKSQIPNQKRWYEERIILLKAESEKKALKSANKEAKDYVKDLDETEFISITEVYQLYEKLSDKCEVFSSKTISDLESTEYLENFYPDSPDDCEANGEQHSWHNLDGENSACYNCLVKRKGKLWETRD